MAASIFKIKILSRPAVLCLLVVRTFAQVPTPGPASVPSNNTSTQSTCVKNGAYSRLDFWLGSWDVVDDTGAIVGGAVIQKILGGCAVQYQWKDPDGSETLEIFFYVAASKQWRQFLVSDSGRTMERSMTENQTSPNRLRFEGKGARMSGGTFMDRSTITAVSGDEVHQVIERSLDGKQWQTSFDARYRRRRSSR